MDNNFKSMMLGSGASGQIFYFDVVAQLSPGFYLLRLEPADAVFSHVQLESCGAIATGPNMSGKSTLMRALGTLGFGLGRSWQDLQKTKCTYSIDEGRLK